MSSEPIFVAGPDRSGTSLMFALLASHPQISMVRRTNMWRYFHRRYGDLGQADHFERCLTDMVRYNRMKHLAPDPERIRREFKQGQPTYGRLFALFHQHHAERQGKPRWGDKSLHTEHYADRVLEEYPDARIIHMTRDPRDRYASVRKRHGRDLARVGAATGRWLVSMWRAERNRRRFPDNYKVVRFESLVNDLEATVRDVCAFIHVEYTPAMLAMDGAPEHTNSGGNSSFGQIEPGTVSKQPVGRFRQVLSSAEIAFIQLCAGRSMQTFGYQLEPVQFTGSGRAAFYLIDMPASLARMVGWLGLSTIRLKKGARIPAFRLVDPPLISSGESR